MIKYLLFKPLILISLLLIIKSELFGQVNLNTTIEDYSNLKVTEINYHPQDQINGVDTIDGGDFEFIEFKNIGETAINLTGLVLDSAVYYEFPNDISLGAGQFWVVASKPAKFLEFYGMEPSGNFSGSLSNSGEEILVREASGNPVIDFIYDDHSPWPESPDGSGYTLVSSFFDPTGNPMDEAYWRASLKINGSPFRDDDGIVDISSHQVQKDDGMIIYPNPANETITISLNGRNENQKFNIKIFSVNGLLVYQTEMLNNEKLNLKTIDLQFGLYFVRVVSDNLYKTSQFIYAY